MHFDVRLLQRVPCAFLPLARIARLRPSRFRLTVPNPARRRGRVADACVLLALIRNGANAPAFSDAPPFALQRRVCAAGIATASSGAPPRHSEVAPFATPPPAASLTAASAPPVCSRGIGMVSLPSSTRRARPALAQALLSRAADDRVGLLLDRGGPQPLPQPAPVDPLCASVSTRAAAARPSPLPPDGPTPCRSQTACRRPATSTFCTLT